MDGGREVETPVAKVRGMLAVIPLLGEITYRRCNEVPNSVELQQLVGGYIQIVPRFNIFNGELCVAYCDEEAAMKDVMANAQATELWQSQSGHKGRLKGPVVILYGDDEFMEAL